MATLLIIFMTIFLLLIVATVILWNVKESHKPLTTLHIYNGKPICEEEAKRYDISYIEVIDDFIIIYHVLKLTNERNIRL